MKVNQKTTQNNDLVQEHPYPLPYLGITLQVHVKYLDEETIETFRKKSIAIHWEKRQKVEDIDVKKINNHIFTAALQNIENLTPRAVKYLIEPNVTLELDEETTWDAPMKFDDNVKKIITAHINYNFAAFLLTMSRDVETLVNARETQEQENLAPISGTSEDHG